jgi:hypothetical protein
VRRKKGRDNAVTEIQKARNFGVGLRRPRKAYWLYLDRGKATLAAIYLRRVRVTGSRFAAALTHL